MKCEYCGREFEYVNAHKPRCKEYQKQMIINEEKITKEEFEKLYKIEEFSIEEIANYFEISKNRVIKKFNEYGIKERPNRYTERRNKKMREKKQNYTEEENYSINKKREEFCLNKYGVTNVRKSEEIKTIILESKLNNIDDNGLNSIERAVIATKETCIKRYGYDNVWKIPEVIQSMTEKKDYKKSFEKGCVTKVEKYGTPYTFTLHKSNGKRLTKPVEVIKNYLDLKGVSYTMDYYIPTTKFYVDFYLHDYNLIIEVYGDYWHCNPNKYKEDQIVKFNKGGSKIVKDVWEYDRNRIEKLNSLDYLIIILWESDINKNLDLCIDKIEQILT